MLFRGCRHSILENVEMPHRSVYTFCFVLGLMVGFTDSTTLPYAFLFGILAVLWNPGLRRWHSLSLMILCLAIGATRAALDQPQGPRPLIRTPQRICLKGVVLESPRVREEKRTFILQVLESDKIKFPDGDKILVEWSGCSDNLEPGERWEFVGTLVPPLAPEYPEAFSQKRWLESKGVRYRLLVNRYSPTCYLGPASDLVPRSLAFRVRSKVLQRLQELPTEASRSLASALLFGDSRSLSSEVLEVLRRTGTSHLVAASGLHMGLLVGLLWWLGAKAGVAPWRIWPLALVLALSFALLAGLSPSITRAATSLSVLVLASVLGRTSEPWNIFCLTLWALLLWEPRLLLEVGFQLSATAVLGILGANLGQTSSGPVKKSLLLTTSISLTTLPIVWTCFGELSKTSLLANLIGIPSIQVLLPLTISYAAFPIWPLDLAVDFLVNGLLLALTTLSRSADPLILAKPSILCLLLTSLAGMLWVQETLARFKVLALALAIGALVLSQAQGLKNNVRPGEVLIRRSAGQPPMLWASEFQSERVWVQQEWQRYRAQRWVRDAGCLVLPGIEVLGENQLPNLTVGDLSWTDLEPYLPKKTYLEVRSDGRNYSVLIWKEQHDENSPGTETHPLGRQNKKLLRP